MSWREVAIGAFRPSRTPSAARSLAKTLLQTIVFWSLFLGILPWGLSALERALGIPGYEVPLRRLLGWGLFALAGLLGLASGVAMALVGRGTPLPTDCARRLVVAGPYRWVRNPMAIAGLAQGVAVGILHGSVLVQLYVLTGALLWNSLVRPVEEADLERRFGAAFRRYRAGVRCWLPRIRPLAGDADEPSAEGASEPGMRR